MVQPALIAVDWGTTNRRAYLLDGDGRVLKRFSDARGVIAIKPGDFAEAAAELRVHLGTGPMLLAGMIGSNRGWADAPYVQNPAGISDLVGGLTYIPDANAAIIPGVKQLGTEPDLMRGEEAQLLGAVAAGLAPPNALACHPGTHAKWVRLRAGNIDAFRTVMTGELFALLRTHSILSAQMDQRVTAGDAFRAGVRRSIERADLSADLFGVRARGLVGTLVQTDAASYASGLLIGADVRIGLQLANMQEPVILIGDKHLTALYTVALEETGRAPFQIDGEKAFVAGVVAIARRMA